MSPQSTPDRNGRRALAKSFSALERLGSAFFSRLQWVDALVGIGIALVVTSLLVGYQFQIIPDYKTGDIADRHIEAPYDFTVEDKEATFQRQRETIERVPGVFGLDLRVNARLESELREAFAQARKLIEAEQEKLGIAPARSLPRGTREALWPKLKEILPRFSQSDVLRMFLLHSFHPDLENQLVKLLQESLKYPGVVLSRETLVPYQDRGVLLRNTITGQDEFLKDSTALKDLVQARSLLRHNRYELTGLSEGEKNQIVTFLDGWVVPNVQFNEAETQALEQLATREVDPVLVQVKKGRTIVRVGDEIRSKELMLLEALQKRKQPRRLAGEFFGLFILVSFFLFGLWHYFVFHQKKHKKIRNHYLLMALVLTASLVITKIFIFLAEVVAESLMTEGLQNPTHFYFFAPLAGGALLVVLLIDVNLAILYSVIFAVFTALLTGENIFFVYTLTGSLGAVYALGQYRERSAIIGAGLAVGAVNVLTGLALQLFASYTDFQWDIMAVRAVGGIAGGVFAAMWAFLWLPILEYLFQITTDIRLLELSNLNKPILRRLAVEAPGTYHHSIMVGTLAEAAAEAIEANALLVRVGAYYHDIGKIKKPEYYVENQIYTSNKHESLSPSMSSLIIAGHVKDGLALAEEINLVPKVRDMIPQHHGTRLMTYFYQKAKDASGEKGPGINENDFRYPGPKPQSKEAAILMLSDQVEAAARTLQDPTPGQIRSLIKRLIQSTIQDGQFDECDITMSELDKIAQAFERTITTMYHHRIEYPGFDFKREVDEKRPGDQRIQ